MKPPLFLTVAVVFCARSARCQETKCLEPTSLQVHYREQEAGDFGTEFPVGSTLRYQCGPGYIKEGTDTWNATCVQKEDGSVDWDIDQYDCSPVSCGHPGDVHNGRLLNFDFHFPKNVRYDCNEGYELEGEPILYCQSDAKWNAPTPTCRIVECSPLESIANGGVSSVGTVFGSKAEFSCYHGFKLVGSSTRTCGADGRWTGQYPYCEVVECGHMEGIANGILVISGTVFGSKANFSCRSGFELVGDNTRTCNAEGRWTGESPHCEVVECGVLEDIANGTVRLSGTVHGSKADFSCNRGFKLVGENIRTCDADGRWTGESPRCEEIWCSEQMIQEFVQRNGNGSVLVGNEPISGRQRSNTRVRYICPPNTDLDGPEINICQENGGWLFDTPACRQKCVVPDASGAFVQHLNSWGMGTIMKPHAEVRDGDRNFFVSCMEGYHLLAASQTETELICRNGAWEPPQPWCAQDECRFEDLPHVENGRPSRGQSLAPRSLATYDCDSQFEIQRAGRLRCIQGQWLGEPPSCVHKKCVVPDGSEAFVRHRDFRRTGTIMKPHAEVRDGERNLFVVCKQGYHLLAARQLETQLICRNGAWEPPLPWCTEDDCRFEDLPHVENGRPSRGQSLAPRSLAKYDCDSQFEIQRAGRLRCIQGQWLGEPPSCVHKDESHNKKRSCAFEKRQDPFKAHRNGISVKPEGPFEHGTKLVFHCEPVGELIFGGPRTAECIDGQWIPPEQPYCYNVGESDIVVRFPDDVYTAPGGTVYVKPNSEVAVDCWSKFPVKLYLEPEGRTHDFPTTTRTRKGLQVKFWLNLNTSARIICRHENASTTREVTVRGQPRYWCPLPSSNSESPQPIRKNAITYQFKCKKGYEIEGKRHLHCLEHGERDAPIPKCKPKFGVSRNHTASPQAEQTVAQPLNPAGPSDAAILAPASRESRYSNCTVPAHGYFWTTVGDARAPGEWRWIQLNQGEKFVPDDVIYLHCADERTPMPVRCADGRWNPEPTCEKGNNCSVEDFFKNAPHGLVIPAAETHVRQNSTFRVSCDDGLTLVGSGSTATCLQDGSWHVPSHMTCIEGCGNFDTGPGGPAVEGRKAVYALGDSITLSCENGMELQPRTERMTCLGYRWSANEVPICVPAKEYETNGVNNKGGKSA